MPFRMHGVNTDSGMARSSTNVSRISSDGTPKGRFTGHHHCL